VQAAGSDQGASTLRTLRTVCQLPACAAGSRQQALPAKGCLLPSSAWPKKATGTPLAGKRGACSEQGLQCAVESVLLSSTPIPPLLSGLVAGGTLLTVTVTLCNHPCVQVEYYFR